MLQSGRFIPEKSNIWRDCVDGYYDWVKEHIQEVGVYMNCSAIMHLGIHKSMSRLYITRNCNHPGCSS